MSGSTLCVIHKQHLIPDSKAAPDTDLILICLASHVGLIVCMWTGMRFIFTSSPVQQLKGGVLIVGVVQHIAVVIGYFVLSGRFKWITHVIRELLRPTTATVQKHMNKIKTMIKITSAQLLSSIFLCNCPKMSLCVLIKCNMLSIKVLHFFLKIHSECEFWNKKQEHWEIKIFLLCLQNCIIGLTFFQPQPLLHFQ